MSKRFNHPRYLSLRKTLFWFVCALFIFTLIAAVLSIRNTQASAQTNAQSSDGVWKFIAESSIIVRGERLIIPQVYQTAQVNEAALRQLLDKAPLEFTQEAKDNRITLALPLPDGRFSTFRIEKSPIMEPGLAVKFPEIKTYRGQGVDDLTATVRFDLTPAGFHALILAERGSIFIDPYSKGDTANYIIYFKADYRNDDKSFQCFFENPGRPPRRTNQPAAPNVVNGATLRTYRLALAANGEYTMTKGGTVAGALSAMTTTMNRVNEVYERELAVRLILVANEDLIIYTNAATDPYSNSNGFLALNQNQANLDVVITSANYDIGHVFTTGSGGVAGLEVVCVSGVKAQGTTGLSDPSGDVFAIDYVAHEMGHQFGGNHTFNGTTSNCGGANREPSAAYEPGSGSTIMAYAGICGAQNLQSNSNDYFHVKSLEEIGAFIASTTCDQETSTGNTVPTVSAGATVTIPKGTPFTLTATGNDANGDAITYCWEEYDLGDASPPDNDADGIARPIFRSFNPTTNPSRTFPKLSDLLNNTSTIGEVLPAITRTMNFQVTVRDNRAGGGGINTATKQVIVNATTGPFLVTQPNTAVTWAAGSQQTVTWNVAGTTNAPVSAANVKISFSTDGGNTFPTVLIASTPNDGSENITVPNTPTSTARIKIEAVGNIFFDISNVNFTIGAATTLAINSVIPPAGRISGGQPVKIAGIFPNSFTVTVGGVSANWVFSSGMSEITVTTPAHAVGAVDIVLTPTAGSPYTKANAFGYLPISFTDDTLVVGETTAKAQHILELRQAVDVLRAVAGQGAAAWSDSTLTPTSTLIKAAHITELRTNFESVVATLGYSPGTYTDPTLSGLVIKRVHIEELRQRIRAIAG